MTLTPRARRALAEGLGTGLLVAVVVGSGIAASRLSPHDAGLQLLENAVATAGGLFVLISLFGPVSGAHLNPVITLAAWWLGRHPGKGPDGREVSAYIGAQLVGGVAGTLLAHGMYAEPLLSRSSTVRSGGPLLLSETVATAGLVLLVFALIRSGRSSLAPAAVGIYIGAGYFVTSSTAFANPAVTLARALTDTFAGIAPASVPAFLAAQLVGLGVGLAGVHLLFPASSPDAEGLAHATVQPHPVEQTAQAATRSRRR